MRPVPLTTDYVNVHFFLEWASLKHIRIESCTIQKDIVKIVGVFQL